MSAHPHAAPDAPFWPLDTSTCAKILLLHFGPPVVFSLTPKHSFVRYAPIPIMAWLVWDIFKNQYPSKLMYWTFVFGAIWSTPFTWLRLLCFEPKDFNDLGVIFGTPVDTWSQKIFVLFKASGLPRWVNTRLEAKNTPSFPKYYERRGMKVPSRGIFLIRQIAILFWQYLAINLMERGARYTISQLEPEEIGVYRKFSWEQPMEKWIEYILAHNFVWFFGCRCLIDANYRVCSIIAVGVFGDSPINWPPLVGRMADNYTLRNFWGKFWHQCLRFPFVGFSNWFCRDLLRLPRPSILERYTNIYVVFLLSGILHVGIDYTSGVPLEVSGAIFFFTSFTFAYMVEDAVQALWKSVFPPKAPSKGAEPATPRWQKIVGGIWVFLYLGIFSAPWQVPLQNRPPTILGPLPADIEVDPSILVGFITLSGAIIAYIFEGRW